MDAQRSAGRRFQLLLRSCKHWQLRRREASAALVAAAAPWSEAERCEICAGKPGRSDDVHHGVVAMERAGAGEPDQALAG